MINSEWEQTRLDAIRHALDNIPLTEGDQVLYIHRGIAKGALSHLGGQDCWCEPKPFTADELRRLQGTGQLTAALKTLEDIS